MERSLEKDRRLLLIPLISLVIVGGIIFSNFLSFSNIQTVVTDLLKNNQVIETNHAAGRMENHILHTKEELITLSKFPQIKGLNAEKCVSQTDGAYEKFSNIIDSLLKADKDGNIIACSSPKFSDFLDLNIKNKDYFTVPRDTREPYIAGTIRQGTKPKLIISVPLFESSEYTPYPNFVGKFKGVLLTIIEMEDLYNLYLHPYLKTEQNDFILYDPETEETLLESPNLDEYRILKTHLPAGRNINTITTFGSLGEIIITSADMILGNKQLTLIVMTPLKAASADMVSLQKRHLFSLFFIFVVGLITTLFMIQLYKSKEEFQSQLKKAKVTLERFGIQADVEKNTYNDSDVSLTAGKMYLIKEEDENHAHELFISTLSKGFAGLGIIREDPTQMRNRYNLKKTSFIWMTKAEQAGIPVETNIKTLYELIEEFIKKSKKSVVLIDRIDYVITENKFDEVIRRIHSLKDLLTGRECIIIIAANPKLIKESHLEILEAETIDLYGKHLSRKINLLEKELDILKYINENNVKNKLVSYGDITTKFNITKPTTRVKIQKLATWELLKIEQVGRFKSLKITSAGRRIIR